MFLGRADPRVEKLTQWWSTNNKLVTLLQQNYLLPSSVSCLPLCAFKLCIRFSSLATILSKLCFSFIRCSFCILSILTSMSSTLLVVFVHFLHFHVLKSTSTTKLLILSKQVECRVRKHTVHLASAPCIGWWHIWQTWSKLSSVAAAFISDSYTIAIFDNIPSLILRLKLG